MELLMHIDFHLDQRTFFSSENYYSYKSRRMQEDCKSLSFSPEMDNIIHGLFKLDLSSEEEKVKRNWLELPPDVMSLIFLKLDTIDILANAQWVCSTWWKLSKQPLLFRSISMHYIWVPFSRDVHSTEEITDYMYALSLHKCKLNRMVEMVKEAVDRSCGQLEDISLITFATDELLYYISQKSRSIKCIRLVDCDEVTSDGLTQVCKHFPQLEELELCCCRFSEGVVVETIGCLCPHLKSFRLNYSLLSTSSDDESALAIARHMPELRQLNLFGNMLTNVGLRAILNGCPHLQSLDLRRCFNLKFEGDLREMCANIKLRFQYDSIDDFEYVNYVDEEDDISFCCDCS